MLLILTTAPLVAFLIIFARMTINSVANFGRYLLVTSAFLAPLCMLGLSEWLSSRARRWLAIGLAVTLFSLAVFALVGVLWPAYDAPQRRDRRPRSSRRFALW